MFDPGRDIDWDGTRDWTALEGESERAHAGRMKMVNAGMEFLRRQAHCVRVVGGRWGNVEQRVPRVAVLLCEVESSNERELGRWVWVVAGDVAPMVVDARRCRNVWQALAEYCDRCERWSRGVREGVMPGGAAPTMEERTRAEIYEIWARWIERVYVEPNRWRLSEPTGVDWEGVGYA